MSHRKTDLGIPCPRKICQSSARACTHKSALCKRGSVNVRFAPKATKVLRCREASLCANSGLLERRKTVCEGPSPEKPMHNAQGRPGKCCGGGGYLSTGNPPPKIDEAVFVGYRLNIGC